MSSRVAEKQRRRAEREVKERELAERERRARRMRIAASAAVAVVLVGVVVTLATLDGGDGGGELPAASQAAFGQHYQGLQERREAAGVSTMGAPSANTHTHPKLAVWANGGRVTVPENIGIDPRRPPQDMAGLHTHDALGTIHNEGQAGATLGQFFAIWGVAFGRDRVGPYRAGNGSVVQMWVDGRPSRAFRSLKLQDGQDIRIVLGPRRSAPPTA